RSSSPIHGNPYLIHRLTCQLTNHGKIHVRGFVEEGTTTTPFDMTVMRLAEHRAFVREDGEDMP
ncbi:hypothetical protein AB9F38_34670, partial [Rhizobium leguminosarum]